MTIRIVCDDCERYVDVPRVTPKHGNCSFELPYEWRDERFSSNDRYNVPTEHRCPRCVRRREAAKVVAEKAAAEQEPDLGVPRADVRVSCPRCYVSFDALWHSDRRGARCPTCNASFDAMKHATPEKRDE